MDRASARLWVLRVAGALLRPYAAKEAPSVPQRILLIRPDHLGDLLFATPALRLLRKNLPDAYIACLVGPWGKAVLRDNPHVNGVHTCPFPGFTRRPKGEWWRPYLLLEVYSRRLRHLGFDSAVVMRFDHWWGAWLTALARIPRRVGYDIPEVRPFLTEAVPYRGIRHEVERNLVLAATLARVRLKEPVRPEDHPLVFRVRDEDTAWVEAEIGPGPFVGIHPGAGWPVKLWPPEKWAAVADALAGQLDLPIVLTGTASERPLTEAIAARMQARAINLAGKTSLGRLAALWSRCRLVLGVDSGPLHLAVAAGAPTVHIFGPSDPRLFGPWGPSERHVVVRSDAPCAPCNRLDYGADELDAHPCVRDIPVERVLEGAEKALNS